MLKQVAEEANIDHATVTKVAAAIFEAITKTVERNVKVSIYGFGTFRPAKIAARRWTDPLAQKKYQVPEQKVIRFTPGETLKNRIRNA